MLCVDETTELTGRKPEEQVKSWVLEHKDHIRQSLKFEYYTLRNNVW